MGHAPPPGFSYYDTDNRGWLNGTKQYFSLVFFVALPWKFFLPTPLNALSYYIN